jgi:hypothetical protein
MYKEGFFLKTPVWNNAFSFEQRKNKALFVGSLKKINSLNEIQQGSEIVFEDFDFKGNLTSSNGLENFYEIDFFYKEKIKKCYLFDNHNHAFFFWYFAKFQNIIGEKNILLHIDAHSDMRATENYLSWEEIENLEKVFTYTNFQLNVGNYIIPAMKSWLIEKIIQIRDEQSLEKEYEANIINLDLDFFSPELDYIDYERKKIFILRHLEKVDFLTVASSPFFISQTLAIQVFQDIFKNIEILS